MSRFADDNLSAVKTLQSQILPARITLISHASTPALRRAAFPLDESLVDGEIEKIGALGWTAPRAQHIWCGPEKRTQQTAKALGLELCVAVELGDLDYGSWNGKGLVDIQSSDPEGLAEWLTNPNARPHGGESLAQLIGRLERWMAGRTTAGHTLAVTHPAVIRAAICCALQTPADSFWRVEVAPLSLTDLRLNGKVWTVRAAGCSLRRS